MVIVRMYVTLNFSKAFDTVSIPKLIQKCKFYGLHD